MSVVEPDLLFVVFPSCNPSGRGKWTEIDRVKEPHLGPEQDKTTTPSKKPVEFEKVNLRISGSKPIKCVAIHQRGRSTPISACQEKIVGQKRNLFGELLRTSYVRIDIRHRETAKSMGPYFIIESMRQATAPGERDMRQSGSAATPEMPPRI